MIKIILEIDGMSCGMCESHINDVIRRNFPVKKVISSHKKGETEIISENIIDEEILKKIIGETGYKVLSVKTEPYKKRLLRALKKYLL